MAKVTSQDAATSSGVGLYLQQTNTQAFKLIEFVNLVLLFTSLFKTASAIHRPQKHKYAITILYLNTKELTLLQG